MSDLYGEEQEAAPEDLCRQAFSRCYNWPDDLQGQIGLAQGLKAASDRYHVAQAELVAKCKELSAFCPTDHDMLETAREIAEDRVRRAPEVPPWMRPPRCMVCGDTGWKARRVGMYDCAERCPEGCAVPDQKRFGGNI